MIKKVINDIKKFKTYVWYQATAELKNEIVNSYMGWIWLFLEPFCYMWIYYFIGQIVFKTSIEFYPVYVFSGLILWNFFSKVISGSVRITSKYKEVINKIYVPKYMLIIISILVNFFKLCITFILLLVFAFIFKIQLSLNILLILPVLLVLILFTFGTACILLHFGVFIKDLVNVTNIILKFTFYFSGIIYSVLTAIPEPYNYLLYYLNPLALLIDNFRQCFMYSNGIDLFGLFIWFIISVILCIIGIKIIYKYENTYVKVMM